MNDPAFGGRVAVVTGGAGALGRALCSELTARGALVAALDLEHTDAAALSLACDLSDEEQIANAMDRVGAELGDVGLLVCAAGTVSESPVAELSLAEWTRVVHASLTSAFLAVRAAVPVMRTAGGGKIVAVSSGYSRRPYPNGAHYAAAKAGLEALVRSLAAEVAADGILVNAVAPGPFESPMTDHVRASPARLERTQAAIPLGRLGTVQDIVGPILFLLGPGSDYVTGQVLHVNGGIVMP